MPHQNARRLAAGRPFNFQMDLAQVDFHRDKTFNPCREFSNLFFGKGPYGNQAKKTRFDALLTGFIHGGQTGP